MFQVMKTHSRTVRFPVLEVRHRQGHSSPPSPSIIADSHSETPGYRFMKLSLTRLALAAAATALLGIPTMPTAQAQAPLPSETVKPEYLPAQALAPETLFLLLLAEIAGARGEIDVSVDAYLETARQTRDPRIAQRATEIALFARDFDSATEAARIWSQANPESEESKRILAGLLAHSGDRLNSVQIQLARILAENPAQLEANLLGLNQALNRVQDKHTVLSIINRLTEPYLNTEPAAHVARAQAAINVDDGLTALDAVNRALELRPGWEPAIIMKARLLVDLDATQQAVQMLQEHLEVHPEQLQVRLTLARALVSAGEMEAARDTFAALLEHSPGNYDLMNAVAVTSVEIGDMETASRYYAKAVEAGHPERDALRMTLGRIAEQQNDSVGALEWYRAVELGAHHLDAQIRIAVLMTRQGKLSAARLLLQSLPVEEEDALRVLLAESMLLREASRYADALELIENALKADPRNGELLYESAMLAERLDDIAHLERRLRRLIQLEPDHAHAYNALGYTFADRGIRLDEARQLIEKALTLSPDDPYILDSLGWVLYRENKPDEALPVLERAYALRQDVEIAVHLGEVLWALDRRDEAQAIWDEVRQRAPDNETLRETTQRLLGQQP